MFNLMLIYLKNLTLYSQKKDVDYWQEAYYV
jgi:hypothetical protein